MSTALDLDDAPDGRTEARDLEIRRALADLIEEPPAPALTRTPCDECGRPWVLPGGRHNVRHYCWPCHQAMTRKDKGWSTLTWRGETLPLPAWADRLGITYTNLLNRIARRGLEYAMTAPRVCPPAPCGWCGADSTTSVKDAHDGTRAPACAACAALGAA